MLSDTLHEKAASCAVGTAMYLDMHALCMQPRRLRRGADSVAHRRPAMVTQVICPPAPEPAKPDYKGDKPDFKDFHVEDKPDPFGPKDDKLKAAPAPPPLLHHPGKPSIRRMFSLCDAQGMLQVEACMT